MMESTQEIISPFFCLEMGPLKRGPCRPKESNVPFVYLRGSGDKYIPLMASSIEQVLGRYRTFPSSFVRAVPRGG